MCRKSMMLNLIFCYMTQGLRHIEDWQLLLNIYERIREDRERGKEKKREIQNHQRHFL